MAEKMTGWLENPKYPGDLIFERIIGRVYLEQRLSYCDRGKFACYPEFLGPINHLLTLISNAYYFDLERAKKEIEGWVAIGIQATDEDLRSLYINFSFTESGTLIKEHTCKQCTVRIEKGTILPINLNVFLTSVIVRKEFEQIFVVDEADLFPRVYLDERIATEEIEAWLERRGQLA